MKSFVKTTMLAVCIFAGALFGSGCATQSSDIRPTSEHEAGFVQANGITIAYKSFGPTDRETVLLIAGTGQELIDWPMALIEELVQRGYRVIRYDNRDVGLLTKFTAAECLLTFRVRWCILPVG